MSLQNGKIESNNVKPEKSKTSSESIEIVSKNLPDNSEYQQRTRNRSTSAVEKVFQTTIDDGSNSQKLNFKYPDNVEAMKNESSFKDKPRIQNKMITDGKHIL